MSVTTKLRRLADTKTAIRDAIVDRGVPVNADTPFSSYPSRIAGIPSGPPYEDPWQPDPLWWDIRSIIQADETPGYVAKLIYLTEACTLASDFTGANAYRTSDGAFYAAESPTAIVPHIWHPSGFKPTSLCGMTRWVIRYHATNTISATPDFKSEWPYYAIVKDAKITTGSWFPNTYVMQAFDFINTTMTSTTMNALCATNASCLQRIPAINYAAVTNLTGAFNGSVLRDFDVSTVDFTKFTSFANILKDMRYLIRVKGVMNLAKGLPMASFMTGLFSLRSFTVRNLKVNWNISNGSQLTRETLLDLLNNGLADLTGQTAQTLTLGFNLRNLTEDEKAVATNKNWILA